MIHVSKLHVSMMHVAYSKFVDLRTGLVHILMILVLDPDACNACLYDAVIFGTTTEWHVAFP